VLASVHKLKEELGYRLQKRVSKAKAFRASSMPEDWNRLEPAERFPQTHLKGGFRGEFQISPGGGDIGPGIPDVSGSLRQILHIRRNTHDSGQSPDELEDRNSIPRGEVVDPP
jgi:hypothetical protein